MSETGEGSTGDGSGTGVRTGEIRLEGELEGFKSEFECYAAAAGGEPCWAAECRELLADTEAALERGNIEQGWTYLHAARRLALSRFEGGDPEEIDAVARELLVEADNAGESWRTDAVRARLVGDDGALRENLSDDDLRAARKLLDEGYQRVHLKRHHLQRQLRYLRDIAIGSVVLLVVLALASTTASVGDGNADVLVHPFVNISASEPGTSSTGAGVPAGFLLYVVLAGVLGAALFGIRSIRQQPTSASTPQHLGSRATALTRAAVGAGSALAVFFFLRSGLLTVNVGVQNNQAPFLLAVAFAAGYSQRLVHSTVETVAGITNPEEPPDSDDSSSSDESPGSPEPLDSGEAADPDEPSTSEDGS